MTDLAQDITNAIETDLRRADGALSNEDRAAALNSAIGFLSMVRVPHFSQSQVNHAAVITARCKRNLRAMGA